MKLVNRIILLGFLPNEDTFDNLIIARSIESKIKLTVSEIEKFNIRTISNGLFSISQEAKDYSIDISFSPREEELIQRILEDAKNESSDEKIKRKLPVHFLDLYEYFFPEKENKKIDINEE